MVTRRERCPVCAFPGLEEPGDADRESSEICPCCGTRFGYDDEPLACGEDLAPELPGSHRRANPAYRRAAHLALRRRWIERGMRWWSASRPAPAGWGPRAQLGDPERA
jgi:hypothetical protein